MSPFPPSDALNAGILPPGVAALVERRAGLREPDVLAIESRGRLGRLETEGAVATAEPPAAQIVRRSTTLPQEMRTAVETGQMPDPDAE